MYIEKLATKKEIKDGLTLVYILNADYNGSAGQSHFMDSWELSNHIGGVTIKSSTGDNFLPLNYSLSDLTKDYHKQGRKHASKEAYTSLKNELERDLQCFEVYLMVEVLKNDIKLYEDHIITSDYHFYDGEPEDMLLQLQEYADESKYINEAKKVLNELLS